MNIYQLITVGLVAAVLSVTVKKSAPEFSVYISLVAGVFMLVAIITAIKPALDQLTALTGASGVDNVYSRTLFKSLAVCYVTQLAYDTCKDAGESAIATKIDWAGRAAILIISLPVFASLAETVTSLINT